MFNKEEIEFSIKICDEYNEFYAKLTKFCEPIAHKLDYNYVTDVGIESKVWFKAEWYGSYQLHDSNVFEFDVDLLETDDISLILRNIICTSSNTFVMPKI